ncbi:hypothetical protein C474_12906 [Halogeometricum pallidum JCM 14848]|uniref:DUF4112 domain-containing protein n=1 Tax=Halogeometricum pallidum JCM 14848 TaxID=1227487 RepID=M0D708_HALPD|nr:DUF4112 domain-containing protein [Halogeometricum pallidum]ELZ29934.1 hypothetical protein C474_12906 [Halogeometricum pallidum JCM 14848]
MEQDDFADEFDGYDGEIPEGVDRAAVERMRTVVRVFDDLIDVPGTNTSIGLDPILGLVPVVGDLASAAFSLYIVAESARLGVSYRTLVAMLANVAIDTAGGAVPYIGTLFDAVWKANKWNFEMAMSDLQDQFDFDDDFGGGGGLGDFPEDDGGDDPVVIDVE